MVTASSETGPGFVTSQPAAKTAPRTAAANITPRRPPLYWFIADSLMIGSWPLEGHAQRGAQRGRSRDALVAADAGGAQPAGRDPFVAEVLEAVRAPPALLRPRVEVVERQRQRRR